MRRKFGAAAFWLEFSEPEDGTLNVLNEESRKSLQMPGTLIQVTAWVNGMHIQTALHDATDEQRKFILSGLTPEEWNKLYREDE